MRRDLRPVRVPQEDIVELRMLTAHRADLAADRVRRFSRRRSRLLGVFPALERNLDFTNKGPLVLISMFQSPQQILEAGRAEVERRLRERRVRHADRLAATAVDAARSQQIRLPGEVVAVSLVARLALDILDLDQQLAEVDALISERFRAHPQAEVIASMTGIGDLLGAEFLAATGGDMSAFASADHLAGYAGLAPAPRDSGRRSGNLHRPRRYNRQLQRVFYTSTLLSIQRCPASRAFYDRKRREGKRHTQAVLALARRRVNVLWAMLRDGNGYQHGPRPTPIAA
jgi:transposase